MVTAFLLLMDNDLQGSETALPRKFPQMLNVAAVTVPAHGFIVGKKGLMAPGATKAPNALGAWMKTFFGACLWAAMMAGGLLLYQHFVKKWEERGFPVLPVAALTTASTQTIGAPGRPGGIPLTAGSSNSSDSSSRPRQMSWLDEYDG